ncbi:MAG: tetratricopeptide repeat protein [Cyclobacteriaceae bacterium]
MPADRITQLEKFYEEDPHDPFNAYALALEYLKAHPEKSRAMFQKLLNVHPEYLPTYYHAAIFFAGTNDKKTAIDFFEKGMSLARKLNDTKTLRELQSAYDELMFE